ncbi:MAG TPA: alanine racemase [bacterium]|jgi:alanine racemase|nr:alanine racemase [bacterium]
MMLRPTWVEVDLKAIRANLQAIKKLVGPQVKVMAVVKANAYGHGAFKVAQTVLEAGAASLAVATLDEAVALREQGINVPILVMGTSIPGGGIEEAIRYNIAQALCSVELAQALSATAQKMRSVALAHLKIDTGMGRIGIGPETATRFMDQIAKLPGLQVGGIFSHFASADEADKEYTGLQVNRFHQALENLNQQGYDFSLRHLANSAGILDYPETYFDLVRPGCILYGCWPGPSTNRPITLQRALAFKTRVVYLKTVPAGTSVSYGRTYTTDSRRVLATLPVGYADGFNRRLSNKAEVLIKGKRCPVVGRICMDQCVVDVTNIPQAVLGDEVVLIGSQGEDSISAGDLAQLAGTIDLEILCGIGARVPRIYF